MPLVDAISVVTQCAASLLATSYYVYRLDDNDDRAMMLYVARRVQPVGLALWTDEQSRDIAKLLDLSGAAVHYLRESNNASTAKTRLSMLVIAAEALAGQTTVYGKCQNCNEPYSYGGTNKERLKAVLGAEAHDLLYVKDGGALRHRLFHGHDVPEDALGPAVSLTYAGIRLYLQQELGLESFDNHAVGVPRTFDNIEHGWHFIRLRDNQLPALAALELSWETITDFVAGEPVGY